VDAPSRVFKLIQLSGDWCWRLDQAASRGGPAVLGAVASPIEKAPREAG
jgi:hypothetical protein